MVEQDAAEFIAKNEGFRSAPYRDVGGVWTIGYGTTVLPNGTRVTASTPAVTTEQAQGYLAYYVAHNILPQLQKLANWGRLNKNQQVACIDLAYNIGPETFVNVSSVARAIEGWNLDRVPPDIMLWDKVTVGGMLTYSKGLHNRRQAEAKLFLTPTDAFSGV